MLVDNSVEDINIRIHARKEKYILKNKLKVTPHRIYRMYEKRYDDYVYELKLKHNNAYTKTGFPNVRINERKNKTAKFISSVPYIKRNGKRAYKEFVDNRAKEVEKERKKWINTNSSKWTPCVRPEETIFYNNRKRKFKGYTLKNMIEEDEIKNWLRLVNNDAFKCWHVVKLKIKRRITLIQEIQWNKAEEGKVLKQFKKRWWVDRVINDISDPKVHIIRRMRIGNSDLNSHHSGGINKICKMCDKNCEETNTHFLLQCERYKNERNELKKNVERNLSKMKIEMKTDTLLGVNEKLMTSRTMTKNYFNEIKNILYEVLKFIKKTKRFERKK